MLASVSRAPLSLNALCSVTSHARPHAVIVLSLKVAVSLFPPSLLSGSASSAVHACLLACEDATGALPTLPPPNTSWRLTGRRVAVSSSACGLLARGLARRLLSASPTRMSRLVACCVLRLRIIAVGLLCSLRRCGGCPSGTGTVLHDCHCYVGGAQSVVSASPGAARVAVIRLYACSPPSRPQMNLAATRRF